MAVKVAGEARGTDSYELTEKKLTLSGLPKGAFELEIETEIKPQVRQLLGAGLCPVIGTSACRVCAFSWNVSETFLAVNWGARALGSPWLPSWQVFCCLCDPRKRFFERRVRKAGCMHPRV